MGSGLVRRWRPDWPVPVGAVLGRLRRGPGDPTQRVDASGAHWRGMRTPAGAATLRVAPLDRAGEVEAHAWGEGAAWALDQVPALLGAEDDPAGFDPPEPLSRAWRRLAHARVGRTGLVWEAMVPVVIEQRVTGQEAFTGFRRLVRRYGEPAPGPGARLDLWLQPGPATIRTIPSWEWLHLHIDPARSRTLVGAARVAPALERLVGLDHREVDRRLRSLPGVGEWSSAEVRARALGDADALSVGDYHVAADVGWALLGRGPDDPLDDAGMVELLEPWRPHRLRIQHLVLAAGLTRPRRGPRMGPRTHLPGRPLGMRRSRGSA